ncbi:PAS domain S-box protein [Natranaeroarchaeum aerophilus]|uniref:histidine kinase n=1 Tax=Natranaeroarchaeum aerophilus TaxID=2917711 RepID=A0AAE3FRS4_9EURY|nr:PAS domain S-box protein [Natranaeroarchaeum aerophilus]MCL9814149.1 PAS domain S-box protein [Natranaeroarchaeum aerophilus]
MIDELTVSVVGASSPLRDRVVRTLEDARRITIAAEEPETDTSDGLSHAECIVYVSTEAGEPWQEPRGNDSSLPSVLCGPEDETTLAGAINAGVDAYVRPEEIESQLVERIRTVVTTDSTRQSAERQELEQRDLIIETVADGVYSLDTEGCYTMVNDAVASMTGYSREELLGEHVSTIMTDEDVERGRTLIKQMLDEEGPSVTTYEIELVTRSGERIPCEVIMSLLPGEKPFNGTVGSVRDIREQKQLERELRERKRNVESVHRVATQLENTRAIETIDDIALDAVIDVLDIDVCCLKTTRDGEPRWHVTDPRIDIEEFPTCCLDEQIHQRTVRGDKTFVVNDLHERRDEIRQTNIRSLLSVPVGENGLFQAGILDTDAFGYDDAEIAELLFAHVANAIERIEAEAQLVDERDRFAALFENVPDPVASIRYEGDQPIVLDTNPAFERTFGYDADQLRGESIDRFVVPPDGTDRADELNERGRRGELIETEVERQTSSGRREFLLTVVPVELGEASPLTYAVYTDITDRKRQQQRVEVLNRVLRHDLRNGMNIVKGCAEMLESHTGDGYGYADTIKRRADELISLAEKTRAVEQTLEHDERDLGSVDVVEGVESMVTRIHSEHEDVEFTVSTPDSAHARSDNMLRTAIYHVLDNAVVHNDNEVPVVDVTVSVDDDAQQVTVTVEDDGPGIPREERELLEEDREITQLRHASGLGLWLVNWVVTQSGGTLSFETEGIDGTRVRLTVPKAMTEHEVEPK